MRFDPILKGLNIRIMQGVLLQGMIDIGHGQEAIGFIIRSMSKLYSIIEKSETIMTFLRRFYKLQGGTPESFVEWSMYNVQYRLDPPGTDWIKNPVSIIWNRIGDCNELNFMIGCVLSANGYTVQHVTADGLDADGVDSHYWIRYRTPEGWQNADATLWSVEKKNPFEIDWHNWSQVNYWDFNTGEKVG